MYKLCVYAYIKHKWFFSHRNVFSSSSRWSILLLLLKLYRSICIAICFILEIYWTNMKIRMAIIDRFEMLIFNVKVVCCCFIEQFFAKNVITYFIAHLKIAEHGCLGCYASFRNHVAEHSFFNDYFWNVCLSLNFNGSIYSWNVFNRELNLDFGGTILFCVFFGCCPTRVLSFKCT